MHIWPVAISAYLATSHLTYHSIAVQALNVCIALLDRQPAQAPPQPEAPNTGWSTPVPGSPAVPISSELDLQLEALAVQGISQHTGEGPLPEQICLVGELLGRVHLQ